MLTIHKMVALCSPPTSVTPPSTKGIFQKPPNPNKGDTTSFPSSSHGKSAMPPINTTKLS